MCVYLHGAQLAIALEGDLCHFPFFLEAAIEQGTQQGSAHSCTSCRGRLVPSACLHCSKADNLMLALLLLMYFLW